MVGRSGSNLNRTTVQRPVGVYDDPTNCGWGHETYPSEWRGPRHLYRWRFLAEDETRGRFCNVIIASVIRMRSQGRYFHFEPRVTRDLTPGSLHMPGVWIAHRNSFVLFPDSSVVFQ